MSPFVTTVSHLLSENPLNRSLLLNHSRNRTKYPIKPPGSSSCQFSVWGDCVSSSSRGSDRRPGGQTWCSLDGGGLRWRDWPAPSWRPWPPPPSWWPARWCFSRPGSSSSTGQGRSSRCLAPWCWSCCHCLCSLPPPCCVHSLCLSFLVTVVSYSLDSCFHLRKYNFWFRLISLSTFSVSVVLNCTRLSQSGWNTLFY